MPCRELVVAATNPTALKELSRRGPYLRSGPRLHFYQIQLILSLIC